MALPDSLRPSAPSGPPPRPPKGKRWIWVTLLTLAGIGLPAVLVLGSFKTERLRGWELCADRFVEGLVLGSGTVPGPGGRTGFAISYDLLSERKRESLPFDVFFEGWSRLFDQRGFIVDHIRDGDHDARGRTRDPICYLLFLGGEQQDHSKLHTVRLEITMSRRGSRYSVVAYALRDWPNPRAAR